MKACAILLGPHRRNRLRQISKFRNLFLESDGRVAWVPSQTNTADMKTLRQKNDDARHRVFSEALERRLYELDLPQGPILHQIVRQPDACLNLSMDVSDFDNDMKKKLFETCLNMVTFDRASDPDSVHDMAKIKLEDVPTCFMKIDYIQSYDEERYPDDVSMGDCVRIITIATLDEY